MTKYKTGMEKTRNVLTLAIGDIIGQAKDRGIELTDKQAEDLYDAFDLTDPLMDSYWMIIDELIDNVDDFSEDESK